MEPYPGTVAPHGRGPGSGHPRRHPGGQVSQRADANFRSEFASGCKAVRQDEVNSHGLGIVARNPRTGKKVNHVMIPRNSRLPIEVKRTFYTNKDNQQRVHVRVTEGDAPDPKACSLLGECVISDLPPKLPTRVADRSHLCFRFDGPRPGNGDRQDRRSDGEHRNSASRRFGRAADRRFYRSGRTITRSNRFPQSRERPSVRSKLANETMAKTLDVYRDWLQIKDPARPLNHYQILKLKQFEDDAGKIRENYRKLNAHVRKFAAGEFAKQSQELLNELAKAMLCLTDATRKRDYDASLGRKAERRRPPAVDGRIAAAPARPSTATKWPKPEISPRSSASKYATRWCSKSWSGPTSSCRPMPNRSACPIWT